MKYSDTMDILKTIVKTINDPTIIMDKLGKTEIFQFPNNSNNNMNLNIYTESEDNNIEFNKDVPMTNNKSNKDGSSYNNHEYNDYSKKQKDMSSKPQGIIDSITQELTSVRLQQAIILSEIVGKPKSKTRKRRRF